jgi:ketosteroid isomerase-like protein
LSPAYPEKGLKWFFRLKGGWLFSPPPPPPPMMQGALEHDWLETMAQQDADRIYKLYEDRVQSIFRQRNGGDAQDDRVGTLDHDWLETMAQQDADRITKLYEDRVQSIVRQKMLGIQTFMRNIATATDFRDDVCEENYFKNHYAGTLAPIICGAGNGGSPNNTSPAFMMRILQHVMTYGEISIRALRYVSTNECPMCCLSRKCSWKFCMDDEVWLIGASCGLLFDALNAFATCLFHKVPGENATNADWEVFEDSLQTHVANVHDAHVKKSRDK